MHTHLADLIPQRHEVAEGLGLVLGLAEKGSGMEGAHEKDAAVISIPPTQARVPMIP